MLAWGRFFDIDSLYRIDKYWLLGGMLFVMVCECRGCDMLKFERDISRKCLRGVGIHDVICTCHEWV